MCESEARTILCLLGGVYVLDSRRQGDAAFCVPAASTDELTLLAPDVVHLSQSRAGIAMALCPLQPNVAMLPPPQSVFDNLIRSGYRTP